MTTGVIFHENDIVLHHLLLSQFFLITRKALAFLRGEKYSYSVFLTHQSAVKQFNLFFRLLFYQLKLFQL